MGPSTGPWPCTSSRVNPAPASLLLADDRCPGGGYRMESQLPTCSHLPSVSQTYFLEGILREGKLI